MTMLTPTDREAVRQIAEEQWTQAVLDRDWGKVLAMCTDDVVYMPADHPVLHGQAALRAWFDLFPRLEKFDQPLETIEGQGNLAMSRGSFAVVVDIKGTKVENTGKVLCGLQKDESGRWLVKAVCWNWDRPLSVGA